MITFNFDAWYCPNQKCQFIISDMELQAMHFNYYCPKCGRHKVGNFIAQPLIILGKKSISTLNKKSS